MTRVTVITMVVVIGMIWGGFLVCLVLALQREKDKSGGTADR